MGAKNKNNSSWTATQRKQKIEAPLYLTARPSSSFFLSFFLFFNSLKDSDYLFNFPLSIFCCCCCSPFWFYTAGWIVNCTGKKNPIAKRFVSLHRYDYNRRRRKIVCTYTRFYSWISRLYSSAEAATGFFFFNIPHTCIRVKLIFIYFFGLRVLYYRSQNSASLDTVL